MRIRTFHYEDLLTLVELQQLAVQVDGAKPYPDFAAVLMEPELDATANVFVITDDDDEVNTWGQSGTLEGIEGEIIGYTLVQVQNDQKAYHLLCQGTVHPEHRHRHAGRSLLICAHNRALVLAEEFEFEATQAGIPVYFEALFPEKDTGTPGLAAKCELAATDEMTPDGMRLYRKEL